MTARTTKVQWVFALKSVRFSPPLLITARMNLKTEMARTTSAFAVKTQDSVMQSVAGAHRLRSRRFVPFIAFALLALPSRAHASIFHGETLDSIANGISWVVLVIAPVIGITAFWLVHILPEKIAHKKMHPQTKAIQCLCLLSLCFGGLLWPIAWLWAYTKPVLHKMAYGTDVDKSLGHVGEEVTEEENEIGKLRARVAELEAKLSSPGAKV
jgi:hypothetical protein